MNYSRIFAGTVFLVFAATFAAAQMPAVEVYTTTAPVDGRPGEWVEITTATWDADDWRFLNEFNVELWVLTKAGPDEEARFLRWQATPANRGVMVIEGNATVERSELWVGLRSIRTGEMIDLGPVKEKLPRTH